MNCIFCNFNKNTQTPKNLNINLDLDKNYLIKGDNLDVLHSIQKTHKEKIKLIYIDPPYNTKSKKQYKDKFTHEKWLEFMYPRLVLARDLLRDDGIIFISIDDNEQAQLKILMDDIFCSNNFIGQVVWESAVTKNDEKYISKNHEYILVYRKSENLQKLNGLTRTEKQNKAYKNRDNDPRGVWMSDNFTCCSKGYRYEIITPTGKKYYPSKTRDWRCSEKKYKELLADNRVWFGKDGNNKPTYKRFLNEVQDYLVCPSIWQSTNVGMSGTKELEKIFDKEKVFSYPKGTKLIKHMLQIATKPEDDDIILDFFAGSGTTGHAVLEKNLEDKKKAIEENLDPSTVGNRKYIMVQLDEAVNDKKDKNSRFETIFDICHERMIRVMDKIKQENSNIELDIGFKVFDTR